MLPQLGLGLGGLGFRCSDITPTMENQIENG